MAAGARARVRVRAQALQRRADCGGLLVDHRDGRRNLDALHHPGPGRCRLASRPSRLIGSASSWRCAAWRRVVPDRQPHRLTLLRVFGYQARTESLFDRVAQRWRLRGPVQLIAGADLAMRTTDPGDVLTFIEGRLADRYVRTAAEIPDRLGAPRRSPGSGWSVPRERALLPRRHVATDAAGPARSQRSRGCRPQKLRPAECRLPLRTRGTARTRAADRVAIVHDRTTDPPLCSGNSSSRAGTCSGARAERRNRAE